MILKIRKTIIIISLALSGLFVHAENSSSEAQMDSILASVNGIPIVLSDIVFESERDESILAAALNQDKAKEIIVEMRKKLIDDIINRKLILEEYENSSFRIPEEYINSAIDDIAKSTNYLSRKKFYQLLRQSGIDLHEFREKIREKVIVEYLVGKRLYNHVTISPKNIYEYYQTNKLQEFTLPDKIELSMIFLDKNNADYTEKLAQITEKLKSDPNNFPYLAAEFSDHEMSKKNNGVLGLFAEKEIREEFSTFVAKKELGIVSEPITAEEGTYFLLLNRIEKGREIPLREVEQDLRRKLETMERSRIFAEYIERLRKNAIIEYYF